MSHRITGYIAFDIPADDCAIVKITMEAAVKDLGGEITNYDYARDDYDPHDYGHSDQPRRIPDCQCSYEKLRM